MRVGPAGAGKGDAAAQSPGGRLPLEECSGAARRLFTRHLGSPFRRALIAEAPPFQRTPGYGSRGPWRGAGFIWGGGVKKILPTLYV